MDIDGGKLEQVVLALLHLNSFKEGAGSWHDLTGSWVIFKTHL